MIYRRHSLFTPISIAHCSYESIFLFVLRKSSLPEIFGEDFIVPLVNDRHAGSLNNAENYREIALMPVISKVLKKSLSLNV